MHVICSRRNARGSTSVRRTKKNSPDARSSRAAWRRPTSSESAAQRDKIASDIKEQDAKKNKGQRRQVSAMAAQAREDRGRRSQQGHIVLHEDEERVPQYSKIDEVLYYLAYEHEQAADYKKRSHGLTSRSSRKREVADIPKAYLGSVSCS